jgi:hypothetical protein
VIWLREGHRLKLSLAVVSGLVAAYTHSVTLIAALLGLVGGGLLTYLGLFLVGYGGGTGGDDDVYVNLGGTRIDADVVASRSRP